ncbi:MAG: EAL domain-containing protein [SAR324 cluster bacterium]|nr:EAL domain-containing protein [SAR324 cluster bacterium]
MQLNKTQKQNSNGSEETGRQKSLRERAAQLLETRSPDGLMHKVEYEEVKDLVHQLQVFQIELEMQNDELLLTQVELSSAKDEFVDLYDFAPIGYVTLDEVGCVVRSNHQAGSLLGVERANLMRKPLQHFINPEDHGVFFLLLRDTLADGESTSEELRFVRVDEEGHRLVRMDFKPHVSLEGEAQVRATLIDITERELRLAALDDVEKKTAMVEELYKSKQDTEKAYEQQVVLFNKLQENNSRLQLMGEIYAKSSEAILVTDHNNIVIEVNPSFEKISGYSKEEVLGKTPSAMSSGRHDESFYKTMWKTIHKKGYWQGEIWDRRKNGEIYPKELSITKLEPDETGKIKYLGIFSDITEAKKTSEQLRQLAFNDPLTGLANRALCTRELSSRLKDAKRRKKGLAVLFIDLDGFKSINDSMGHKMGDEVLVAVAKEFQNIVRASDLVCRHGGDEFLVLLSDLKSAQEATKVTDQLIKYFENPVSLSNGKEVYLGCSIGISFSPNDSDNPEDLIRYADTAMYEAKKAGKGQYHFFSEEVEARVVRRAALDYKLHNALDNGEFVMFYQPQVNSKTGQLIGMESLIRWQNPEEGLINPVEFIPIAEETGLINKIGEFVLEESCRQNKLWQDAGICNIVVSVNSSVRQFESGSFPSIVENTLKKTGLDAKYLKIEITESLMIENTEQIVAQLHQLKDLGIGISMDDFGTGYSSLSVLKSLPLTDLKIDRDFIKDISKDQLIAQVVVDLAENMILEAVAEGAEDWEQIKTLHKIGCNIIQGFFYSKPLNAVDFEEFVAAGKLRSLDSNGAS